MFHAGICLREWLLAEEAISALDEQQAFKLLHGACRAKAAFDGLSG
jgi:hypothetical protein